MSYQTSIMVLAVVMIAMTLAVAVFVPSDIAVWLLAGMYTSVWAKRGFGNPV